MHVAMVTRVGKHTAMLTGAENRVESAGKRATVLATDGKLVISKVILSQYAAIFSLVVLLGVFT